MKNERGTETSKTIKTLKICHNKWLSKKRSFQVPMSSEEHLLFCPVEQHIIATHHSFSYFTSRFFKAGITALLTQYFKPFSSQKKKANPCFCASGCTHTPKHMKAYMVLFIYVYIYMHIQRLKTKFISNFMFFSLMFFVVAQTVYVIFSFSQHSCLCFRKCVWCSKFLFLDFLSFPSSVFHPLQDINCYSHQKSLGSSRSLESQTEVKKEVKLK